jgi:zinc transport system ATP-binding protein
MASEPLIEARDVCVSFARSVALDHVDLALGQGEIVTLIGLNGSGKTTLVRVLLGLLAPTEGEVRRKPGLRIGYTPQGLPVDRTMPMTVARFLTLGQRAPRTRLAAALDEVGAGHVLDSQISHISGGELHRVALARALLREPDLLVLDEPMSGVDVAGQADLYGLIGDIRGGRGCGVLLVSHDLHLVMAATDTVVCLNHHVCCTGRPEAVIGDPAFTALFGDRYDQTLAVYRHAHDHVHDPSGRALTRAGEDTDAGGRT